MPDRAVRILLVEDHDLVRSAFVDLLSQGSGFEVVAAAASPAEALRRLKGGRYDLALIDIELKDERGTELAVKIRRRQPHVKIVFVSGNIYDQYVEHAIDMEADGFISKREGAQAFLTAIRQIALGERVFCDEVLDRMAKCPRTGQTLDPMHTRRSLLTQRQIEILRHIAHGVPKKDIATLLGIAVKTIDSHSSNLMQCLGIHDRVALARYAVREGIIRP